MMNYESSLIKRKCVEIKDLPAVAYTEISLNERFSQPALYRGLPSLDTRFNNPMKQVQRIYFTNYSGGLSKKFSALKNDSTHDGNDISNRKIGDTQWWTTSGEWRSLPYERIHSIPSSDSNGRAGGVGLHGRSAIRRNSRSILFTKSLTVTKFSSLSVNESGPNPFEQVTRRYLPDIIPNPERYIERSFKAKSDLRQKLLDYELNKYMGSLKTSKICSQQAYDKNQRRILLPNSLVVTIPTKCHPVRGDEIDSTSLEQNYQNNLSKRLGEKYCKKGSHLKQKDLEDELDKHMGNLQITKVLSMDM